MLIQVQYCCFVQFLTADTKAGEIVWVDLGDDILQDFSGEAEQ